MRAERVVGPANGFHVLARQFFVVKDRIGKAFINNAANSIFRGIWTNSRSAGITAVVLALSACIAIGSAEGKRLTYQGPDEA
jgi:hypothetical protein